jgi:hypothetical protein
VLKAGRKKRPGCFKKGGAWITFWQLLTMANHPLQLARSVPACIVLIIWMALLGACSMMPSSGVSFSEGSPLSSGELTEAFKNGDARLQCETECWGKHGEMLRHLKMLHDYEVWNKLAVVVLRVGYHEDLTYYYLGRAAEGLGYYHAAEIYYRRSNSSHRKCAQYFPTSCDGFVFPRDADSRLAIVTLKNAEIRAKNIPEDKPVSSPVPPPKIWY